MNNIKKIRALLLCALLLCAAVSLCACAEDTPANTDGSTGEAAYRVTVKDAMGNPYSAGVIVKFMQNGEQVAMQVVNENGVAEKTLAKGEYTVELMYTDTDATFRYDTENVTLTADKTELEIRLAYAVGDSGKTLVADGKEFTAYNVGVGCTYVSVTAGERSYFLFTPTEVGKYEFSVSDGAGQVGYYGTPYFVQSSSLEEIVDNKLTVSVYSGMISTDGAGTTVMVIGVDAAEGVSDCYLNIANVGDPDYSIAEEPWTVYQTTAQLAPYVPAAGTQLKEFDLTAASDKYNLVYNEADGFYHLDSVDGPLVLVRLSEKTAYLDSIKTILENTGVTKYFFDENGSFVKKESYTNCLMDYLQYVDEATGTYPLTEDLKYIIQSHGEYAGWWNAKDSRYRFVDADGNPIPGINADIAWLFLCCYAE